MINKFPVVRGEGDGPAIFALGALVLVGFVFGLATGHSLDRGHPNPLEEE
ncbi:MAG: hypothetical protein ABSH53_24200 [Holophaga sp.]|jgi:hypothetical protein